MDVAPWMQTASGARVDLDEPTPDQIFLYDIAHHLARLPRFNGACRGPVAWTVADHSLLVEQLLPDNTSATARMAALLHDAHEAYVGDRISPVKAAVLAARRNRKDYSDNDELTIISRNLQDTIHRAFALPTNLPDVTKAMIDLADRQALRIEFAQVMLPPPSELIPLPDAPELGTLCPQGPVGAAAAFMTRAMALISQRHRLD